MITDKVKSGLIESDNLSRNLASADISSQKTVILTFLYFPPHFLVTGVGQNLSLRARAELFIFSFLIGFAVVLLVIHYLQAGCTPQVLPTLQKDFPELFRSPNTTVITELTADVPHQVQSYKSNNTQSLGELLIGFFQYYSTFNWDRTISLRVGGTQPTRHHRIWSGPYIKLEDPTDEGNVTRGVYSLNEFTRIKNAFKSASTQLNQTVSLHDILK